MNEIMQFDFQKIFKIKEKKVFVNKIESLKEGQIYESNNCKIAITSFNSEDTSFYTFIFSLNNKFLSNGTSSDYSALKKSKIIGKLGITHYIKNAKNPTKELELIEIPRKKYENGDVIEINNEIKIIGNSKYINEYAEYNENIISIIKKSNIFVEYTPENKNIKKLGILDVNYDLYVVKD